MTDQTRELTVILDRDYRTDDVQEIINAIRALRGVSGVLFTATTPADYAARAIAKTELLHQLRGILALP